MTKLTKTNCKSYPFIFSVPLVLCLEMEGFECVSMSLYVCVGWCSIFSFPHIKGAINFPLLLLPECNTHAPTAECLGPDLANTQDELIYQTTASIGHPKSRPTRVYVFPEDER